MIPVEWHTSVERAREKAKTLLENFIAVYQTNFIVTGILKEVGIERLWSLKYPYCKLKLDCVKKFDLEGKQVSESDEETVFVNKPEFIFSKEELKNANKKVYEKACEIYGFEPS